MNVLAFDTALGRGSAAVLKDGRCVARAEETEPRALAERLVPMIEQALGAASLTYLDLDRIGVVVGPGTFTGLRIGVATARGLMLATGVPALGVTSLEALAATHAGRARSGESITVAQDARRGQIYMQSFSQALAPAGAPVAVAVEDAADHVPDGNVLMIGTAAGTLAAERGGGVRTLPAPDGEGIDAACVGALAARMPVPAAPPKPLYLRAPDARLPARRIRSVAAADAVP